MNIPLAVSLDASRRNRSGYALPSYTSQMNSKLEWIGLWVPGGGWGVCIKTVYFGAKYIAGRHHGLSMVMRGLRKWFTSSSQQNQIGIPILNIDESNQIWQGLIAKITYRFHRHTYQSRIRILRIRSRNSWSNPSHSVTNCGVHTSTRHQLDTKGASRTQTPTTFGPSL